MTETTLDPDALAAAIAAGTVARMASPGESNVQRAQAVTVIEISAYLARIDDDRNATDDPGVEPSSGRLVIPSLIVSVAALLISVFSLGMAIGQTASFRHGHASLSTIGLGQ